MKTSAAYLFVIFMLIGLLCLLGAYILGVSTVWGGALLNLGVVFISIVVLDRFWNALGGEPLQARIDNLGIEIGKLSELFGIVRDSESTGVSRIVHQSDNYATGSTWQDLLRSAKQAVDLCGSAQHGWLKDSEGFKNIVTQGLSKGCRYRILLYSPVSSNSPAIHPIRQIIETERSRSVVTASNNIDSLKFFLSFAQSIPQEFYDQFKVRVVEDKVFYNIISRFDDIMYVIFYMYHQRSESSPMLEIRGPKASLFQSYAKEFELLWKEKSRKIELEEVLEIEKQKR